MITVQNREYFLREVKNNLPVEPLFCAEIGVLNGEFSELIYYILNPVELILIDPFENGADKYENGRNTAYSGNGEYKKVKGRFSKTDFEIIGILPKYSHEVVNGFADGYFHFIYHDASHLFKDIKRDLVEWLPKIESDGVICGHDYIQLEDFGVIQAVDEFCKEHNFEMIIYNENGGDYALKCTQ